MSCGNSAKFHHILRNSLEAGTHSFLRWYVLQAVICRQHRRLHAVAESGEPSKLPERDVQTAYCDKLYSDDSGVSVNQFVVPEAGFLSAETNVDHSLDKIHLNLPDY